MRRFVLDRGHAKRGKDWRREDFIAILSGLSKEAYVSLRVERRRCSDRPLFDVVLETSERPRLTILGTRFAAVEAAMVLKRFRKWAAEAARKGGSDGVA